MPNSKLTKDIEDNNSRERLDLIINATGIGIWDWQIQTGSLSFNDRWAEMIGYKAAELEPINFNTWSKNLHSDDLEKAQIALHKHFSGESEVYEIELLLIHKLGHIVWVLASGKVVEWADDKQPKRMIGMHIDITTCKENEESLIQASC